MRKRLFAVVFVFMLASCGSNSEAGSESKAPRTQVEFVTDWSDGRDYGWLEVKVNGRLCIQYRDYNGSGLSCDWSAR